MVGIYTVSEINNYIKNTFSLDENLKNIRINGEISNFVNHVRSGHYYFSVKDKNSSLKCVMFKSSALKLAFIPENGMNVSISGSIQVFDRDGIYQLYCTGMVPDGIGQLYSAFEAKKSELQAKGLFDAENKKALPRFPKKIGIITSKTGAALQDILNILRRRYPISTAVIIPCLVQGGGAPVSVCEAFERIPGLFLDVVILARGGGSIEDLWAFNDERIVHSIHNCDVPVITGIGHETDFTLADFAADLRAPTPTAAAELAAPDINELYERFKILSAGIKSRAYSEQEYRFKKLRQIENKLNLLSPHNYVKNNLILVSNAKKRLNLSVSAKMDGAIRHFHSLLDKLESLNPMSALKRGYSYITDKNGNLIDSVNLVQNGQDIVARLNDGDIISRIYDIKKTEN